VTPGMMCIFDAILISRLPMLLEISGERWRIIIKKAIRKLKAALVSRALTFTPNK
jgi:hypothetical protein